MMRLALVVLVTWMASAGQAHATANFPFAVQTFVGTDTPPDCRLCHASLAGGLGTIVQPFGQALVAQGLVAYDLASLERALEAAERGAYDSDDDGVDDLDELARGEDPNTASEPPASNAGSSGCSFARARGSHGFVGLLAAALMARLLRRQRMASGVTPRRSA